MSATNPYGVQLGDWRATGGGHLDADGNRWYLAPLQGWRASGARRAEFADRERRDGAFDDDTFAGARVITVEGTLRSPSMADRDRAADRVTALLGDGGLGRLLVTEAHMTRFCDVRLSDETTCDPINARTSKFSIQVTAPDSRRYSAAPSYAETRLRTTGAGGLNFAGEQLVARNLQTNPSLATTQGDWSAVVAGTANISRTSVTGFARGFTLRVGVTAVGQVAIYAPGVAVESGQTYQFVQTVRSSRAQQCEMRVQWIDTAGQIVQEDTSPAVALAANIPRELAASGYAPAAAVRAITYVLLPVTAVNDIIHSTMAAAAATTAPITYFDGDSTGGVWEGAAGNSISRQTTGVTGLGFPLDFGTAGNPGLMALLNQGTITVEPTLTVYGPCQPFSLLAAESGGRLSYEDSLNAGDLLTISIREKEVILNNLASRYTAMSDRDFNDFVLRPNVPLSVGFAASNDENTIARAVAEWNDGYR